MDNNKAIPWACIEAQLARLGESQTWLAARLNLATNVVTNWKRRNGAPMSRAQELARVFAVPVETLLRGGANPEGSSKAAQRLIVRLRDMDSRGILTKRAEDSIAAFLDLLEGMANPPSTKGRR